MCDTWELFLEKSVNIKAYDMSIQIIKIGKEYIIFL